MTHEAWDGAIGLVAVSGDETVVAVATGHSGHGIVGLVVAGVVANGRGAGNGSREEGEGRGELHVDRC